MGVWAVGYPLINPSTYRPINIFQFVFIDFKLCIRYFIQLFKGKMTELAEGARLEIVCTVNSGTPGSNPGLSALLRSVISELRRAGKVFICLLKQFGGELYVLRLFLKKQ